MVFNPNRPIATEFLSSSQALLLSNNQDLDKSFGVDHYPFSDPNATNGFHNRVTTPIFVDNPATGAPPTTGSNPIFYAFQDTSNIGTLQYSRGVNDSVPTPLTNLYSTSTPISMNTGDTINILDLTGVTLCHFSLFVSFFRSGSTDIVSYSVISYRSLVNPTIVGLANTSLVVLFSGTILQIKNNGAGLTNLYWDINFFRIQTS